MIEDTDLLIPTEEYQHEEIKPSEKKEKNSLIEQSRVEVKAIEFDWIFYKKEGSKFLRFLATTENVNIFQIKLVKDLVLFQWQIMRISLLWRLFVPYFLFWCLFIFYSTVVIKLSGNHSAVV